MIRSEALSACFAWLACDIVLTCQLSSSLLSCTLRHPPSVRSHGNQDTCSLTLMPSKLSSVLPRTTLVSCRQTMFFLSSTSLCLSLRMLSLLPDFGEHRSLPKDRPLLSQHVSSFFDFFLFLRACFLAALSASVNGF